MSVLKSLSVKKCTANKWRRVTVDPLDVCIPVHVLVERYLTIFTRVTIVANTTITVASKLYSVVKSVV